ncbi:hypothetical protein SLEP1_g36929 [Rubroshorea leprosula]|uniref:Uncharacterized protein n=1 Tax=Rubroshorea leprosula TaxID=152421 RepID=A0AAV5KTN6_9ROSI|nr:hypothetical protein SLEP1_g36929 [Rubroshorea leprosula]
MGIPRSTHGDRAFLPSLSTTKANDGKVCCIYNLCISL